MDNQALKALLNELLNSKQFAEFATQQAELFANLHESWQYFQQEALKDNNQPDNSSLDLLAQEEAKPVEALDYAGAALQHDLVMPTETSSASSPMNSEALDLTSSALSTEDSKAQNANPSIQPSIPSADNAQALNPTDANTASAFDMSLVIPSALLGNTAHQNQTTQAMPPFKPEKFSPSAHTPSAASATNFAALPNAQQGKPYDVSVDKQILSVRFTSDCGLIWDSEKHRIHGIPTISGDIKLFFQLSDNRHIEQTLYINADPQSLWKNLPSDQSDRFYKPDTHHDSAATPFANLVAARVRGRSHAHIGSFCDDDFVIRYFPTGDVHLLCVSDGAGSAKFSRYGSQLAVNAVATTIEKLLNDSKQNYHRLAEMDSQNRQIAAQALIKVAAYQAFAAHHQAQNSEVSLKSLSCTLLIAISLPLPDGQWLSVSYWVGDGAIGIYTPESTQITLMGEADSGQYSGETRFLSREDVEGEIMQSRIRQHISPSAPLLILMTDGVSDPKFETEAQLAQGNNWQALWQELQTPLNSEHSSAALQNWLQFWSPGNHDDRTIALMIPQFSQTKGALA